MKRLRLNPLARRDITTTRQWFLKERRYSAAEKYDAALQDALDFVSKFPASGRPTPHSKFPGARRWPLRGVPYYLVYVEIRDFVMIIAVSHNRRNPYWDR